MPKPDLLNKIRPLILQLQELQQQKLRLLSHEVWLIVEGHEPFHYNKVDHLLDELMDLALFGEGESETLFKAFLGYVDAIEPELSATHRKMWLEFLEEDKRWEEGGGGE